MSLRLVKKNMACNKPKKTTSHPKKSHVVKLVTLMILKILFAEELVLRPWDLVLILKRKMIKFFKVY